MSNEQPMTDQERLDLAQDKIDQLPPGNYQVSEIFGDLYEAAIPKPQHFGKVFRQACSSGKLRRIRYSHMDEGDKHHYYTVG